ncbi:MAG: PD-(D/E)XK nuclease family protein [Ornithinimicrobium sp.]
MTTTHPRRESAGDSSLAPPSLADPDAEAVLAAARERSPQVIVTLGAPGTGKSTIARRLVEDFIGAGGDPQAALLIAPTRSIAAEQELALSRRIHQTRTEPLVRTTSSLAFAILRHAAIRADPQEPLPRLLSGAEQDALIAELLQGHQHDADAGRDPFWRPPWPQELMPAVGTSGFRSQLRDLLMRCVEHGVGPEALRDMARRHDRPQWLAAADVLAEYEQVSALAAPGAFDPAYIAVAATDALYADPELREQIGARLGLLVVDDAQELTASGAALLAAVHHPGMPAVLLGDGDSVVQAFRGALGGRFVALADDLHAGDKRISGGASAARPRRFVLTTDHRQQAAVAAAGQRVVRHIGVTTGREHRGPKPRGQSGSLEVAIMATPAQEAELIAHRLRQAHLLDGQAWSQMAVIARSHAQHESIRRALGMGGVPVHTQLRGLPLAADPATRPLLLASEFVLRWAAGDLDEVPAQTLIELLTSPLAAADPVALRRLRRAVRRHVGTPAERPPASARAVGEQEGPPSIDEVIARWVLDPTWTLAGYGSELDLAPMARLGTVLWAGRRVVQASGPTVSAHELLWALWDATGLAAEWARASLSGGAAGARADRHLDAVMLLFGQAHDHSCGASAADVRGFVEHIMTQKVLPDSLVARAPSGEGVSVLTPAAAAGRQWAVVAVLGVQEGLWPNLKLRGSLLGAEALVDALHGVPIDGSTGLRSAQSQVWSDELRQFYVALTRATDQLIVTAVASVDEQPSAFIDLIDPQAELRTQPVVPPRLTLRGVVAQLRRAMVAAHRAGDTAARDACADQLLALAADGVSRAESSTWWDSRATSTQRDRVPTGPVPVSPSKLQAYNECALRWLLTNHGGEGPGHLSSAMGTLIHQIAADDPAADLDELQLRLQQRWPELAQRDSWISTRAQARGAEMLARYVAYRSAMEQAGRAVVAVEAVAQVQVGRARLSGRLDRVERDADGSYVVIDLKTGTSKPPAAEIARHPQLGAYQVAVSEGGLVDITGQDASSSGAGLAHLGKGSLTKNVPQMQPRLEQDAEPRWAHDLLERSAEGMAGAEFAATLGAWCRSCDVKACCPLQPEGDRE